MVFVQDMKNHIYNNSKCTYKRIPNALIQQIFLPPEKKEPYSGLLAFIMLPLISPQYYLSSQLPHCQPAQLLPLLLLLLFWPS